MQKLIGSDNTVHFMFLGNNYLHCFQLLLHLLVLGQTKFLLFFSFSWTQSVFELCLQLGKWYDKPHGIETCKKHAT